MFGVEITGLAELDCTDAPELFALELVFARLAAICGHKKTAVSMRLKGDIEAALASERCADHQYQQLPAAFRW
jgi:hypothetical protein